MRFVRNISVKYSTDQSGITGLETAIVLIAFVVVASVFAFTVLTTGLFTSEEAKKASETAIKSTESTLQKIGPFIAGGPCRPGIGSPPVQQGEEDGCLNPGSFIDWSGCNGRNNGFPVDGLEANCLAHAQLFQFKLSPAGNTPVAFDPEKIMITWFDTGGRADDAPVYGEIPLRGPIVETTECLPDSMWCYRWQTGETDQVLDPGEYIEIFIGGSSGLLHGGYNVPGIACGVNSSCSGVEKNSKIVVEVITPDGAVLKIQGRMPRVIQQTMDIDR